jgi:hypothetical protein
MYPDVEMLRALLASPPNGTATDMALRMLSGEKLEPPDADLAELIAATRALIPVIEQAMWAPAPDIDTALLETYQATFRHMEHLIDRQGIDLRHRFVVVIPVADRPLHLSNCLESLLRLCRTYAYGGLADARYRKVAVIIADDSKSAENIAVNRAIAARFCDAGIDVDYFGLEEQLELLDTLSDAERQALSGILGTGGRTEFYHKGASLMRNIVYLKLNRFADAGERTLFYFIDSDQEFQIRIPGPAGDRELFATNFFYYLDQIFTHSGAIILTGKVVGDPPVSPAVMAGNFLDDVIAFLRQIATKSPADACQFHDDRGWRGNDASYHDMAGLFGFVTSGAAYRYRCNLVGTHHNADCFGDFSARLHRFFYGEHPTRSTYYRHEDTLAGVCPARTVYTGNYVFKPEALRYFIPFAALRLRMAGPVLGRIVRAEIPDSFVSANLPMLHRRTVRETGQTEFRPGIAAAAANIDLSGEFERQFYGDVMLFTIEKLTDIGFPAHLPTRAQVVETLEATHRHLCDLYNQRRQLIAEKLGELTVILHAPENWWNSVPENVVARASFDAFVANIARNFGEQSYAAMQAPALCAQRLDEIAAAILLYPQDCAAWQETLARHAR